MFYNPNAYVTVISHSKLYHPTFWYSVVIWAKDCLIEYSTLK